MRRSIAELYALQAWVNAVDTNAMERVLNYKNNVEVLTYLITLNATNGVRPLEASRRNKR